MKIYKRNLEELIHEVVGPFYVSNFTITEGGKIRLATARVSVAGFNHRGQLCELLLSTASIPEFDAQQRKKETARADAMETEVCARLQALERQVFDGRISDTPVLGVIE